MRLSLGTNKVTHIKGCPNSAWRRINTQKAAVWALAQGLTWDRCSINNNERSKWMGSDLVTQCKRPKQGKRLAQGTRDHILIDSKMPSVIRCTTLFDVPLRKKKYCQLKCDMPSIIRHILISKVWNYGKMCTLRPMKYGNCLIGFDHSSALFGAGSSFWPLLAPRAVPPSGLLLFSIQVVALASHVITS